MKKSNTGDKNAEKLGLLALIAIVVSSMIGSGVDGFPPNMAANSAVGPVIIAWAVAGFGMFFIARTFMVLANIRPDLQSGIYMYAQEGFGKFIAFLVAWGYWLMTMFSNVAFAIMIMDVLNYFIPGDFKGGNNVTSIIGASILVWGFNFLVLSGTKVAGFLNFIGTIAKLIPLCVFIVIVLYFLNSTQLFHDFWGHNATEMRNDLGPVYKQVIAPLDVALWCFIGVESAVALSGRAKNKKDVSRATFIGFLISLGICVIISVIPFGVMNQHELSAIPTPSTAGVLQKISGDWAEIFINLGVLISILSSWLAWTMICAEIPMVAAKNETFPKIFTTLNSKGAASVALWVSSLIMQLTLIFVYFANNAWITMLSISAVTVLPAYFASAAYLIKIGVTGEYSQYDQKGRTLAIITGVIGAFFCIFMVYASGIEYAILSPLFLLLGVPIYIIVRRQSSALTDIFKKIEIIYLSILIFCSIFAIYWIYKDIF